jgi:hypothetical protein
MYLKYDDLTTSHRIVLYCIVIGRTHPLIRTAANLTAAHQEGYVNGRYEHEREIAYSFTCKGQDISRVSDRTCVCLTKGDQISSWSKIYLRLVHIYM